MDRQVTLTLSPPAGGPDVSICFSNCSFFFFFASTDWISKIPRDAAFKKVNQERLQGKTKVYGV